MKEIKTSYALPKPFEPDDWFKDKTVVFHHIGAAGGRTLGKALESQYPADVSFRPEGNSFLDHYQDFIALPADKRRNLKYIGGHNAFGIHTRLEQQCRYVTMVRNPAQRFISAYNFRYFKVFRDFVPKEIVTRFAPDELTHRYNSLENCVNFHLARCRQPYGDGYLVDFFSGDMQPWGSFAPENLHTMDRDKKLELILGIVERHFPFIGITELMDESLFVLASKLGWDSVPFWLKISSAKEYPFKIEEPSESMMDKIKHINQISITLYEIFTKKLLDDFNALKNRIPEVEDWFREYKRQRADSINR